MLRDLRTAPRYFLLTTLPASIDCTPSYVVDLSTKGARLQLMQPLTTGARLPFALPGSGGTVTVPATVLWCRMAAMAMDDAESDRFLAGVVFERRIPELEPVIAELVAAEAALPIEDYRAVERFRLAAPVAASFCAIWNAHVPDISTRGARLRTDRLLAIGSAGMLHLRLHGQQTPGVRATVVWSRQADHKQYFESGLSIVDEERWLCALIEELSLRQEVKVDSASMRKKFNPFAATGHSGLLELVG